MKKVMNKIKTVIIASGMYIGLLPGIIYADVEIDTNSLVYCKPKDVPERTIGHQCIQFTWDCIIIPLFVLGLILYCKKGKTTTGRKIIISAILAGVVGIITFIVNTRINGLYPQMHMWEWLF